MEEKFLYHIWDAGHLLSPLKTSGGKNLQVVYQGQFNTGRGPDFRNVIISLDGETLKGDVEIHINSYDWIAHEHHEDRYYNNVILHVVMNAAQQQYTLREDGQAVEILELKNQISDDIRKLLDSAPVLGKVEHSNYCDLLSAVDNDTLISILSSSGMSRFRNKMRRFNAGLMLSDFDQVYYEGMMEALGYEKNKHNMLRLAQAIPLSNIREWQKEGLSALELVSILCCSSGLLDKCRNSLGAELHTAIASTFETQRFFAKEVDIDWQLFRIRPASHPVFRLVFMAALLHKTASQGLLSFFMEQVLSSRSNPRESFKAFAGIFAQTTFPGAETLPQPGSGLIGNIYINIFLPIACMYAEKHSLADEKTYLTSCYQAHPGLMENHILRFMSRYLSATHYKLMISKSIHQQGLIEIFHKHCHYHLCQDCTSGKAPYMGIENS